MDNIRQIAKLTEQQTSILKDASDMSSTSVKNMDLKFQTSDFILLSWLVEVVPRKVMTLFLGQSLVL